MSRHKEDTVAVFKLPRYTGLVGLEMSMKAVPLVRPNNTYSLPLRGSVQPQMSFISPPPTWFTPKVPKRSTFSQG